MGLIKRKDKSLREICIVRLTLWVVEHLRIYSITISCKNKLYLRRVDNRTVKLRLSVILSLSCVYLLRFASIASFNTHTVAFQYSTTILGRLRPYTIHAIVYVHTIHNTLFKRIVHNTVVVEERHGFGYRCGSKTNKASRVEIFKHLAPVAVNTAVTLINDNHVKEIVWQIRIVRKRNLTCRFIIVVIVGVFNVFTFQQREQSLNGGYQHIAVRWYFSRLQSLHAIDGVESFTIVSEAECAEFIFSLSSEIVAIDKEENMTHRSIRQHTIGSKTSGISFSCTCSKHHKSTVLPTTEALFQLRNSLVLTFTQSLLA